MTLIDLRPKRRARPTTRPVRSGAPLLTLAPAAAWAIVHAPIPTLIVSGLLVAAWLTSKALDTLQPALSATLASHARRRDRRQVYRMRDAERRTAALRIDVSPEIIRADPTT